MKIFEQGVLKDSSVYFHTSSNTAHELFFYPLCAGHYYCDDSYVVKRQNYNSFLAMYVRRGKGSVEWNGNMLPIESGNFVLIDCYKPHHYFAYTGWEIMWVHFDGPVARKYYEHIVQQSGPVMELQDSYSGRRSIEKIYNMFAEDGVVNEAIVAKQLTNLLTEFILAGGASFKQSRQSSVAEETIAYIAENIDKSLPLAELAARASFSPYYFTRVFKKETGYTPHEYIVLARVNNAKFYLKSTDLTVKEIAYNCGFSSECSFCTTFKRLTGSTPGTYRVDMSG